MPRVRYASEDDFEQWKERLHLHAVDLRDISELEAFCAFLTATLPRLDIIVNNACQTIRRPASYYSHLLPAETAMEAAVGALGGGSARLVSSGDGVPDDMSTAMATRASASPATETRGQGLTALFAQQAARRAQRQVHDGRAVGDPVISCDGSSSAPAYTPAQLSQLRLTPEDDTPLSAGGADGTCTSDDVTGGGALPLGRLDVNGQQIDLRTTNSWLLRLHDVSTPELVEVFASTCRAPHAACSAPRTPHAVPRPHAASELPWLR